MHWALSALVLALFVVLPQEASGSRLRSHPHRAQEELLEAPKKEATYKDQGAGKCLQNGGEPAYEFVAGKTTEECKSLCDGEQSCSGYSWSNPNNCLLWLPTLAAGGPEWGGCSCFIKQDKSYVNLGAGKCLDNGKDPKYDFLAGKTEAECKKKCDDSKTCEGYSWSNQMNCLLWQQPTLTTGGAEWGKARCFVKDVMLADVMEKKEHKKTEQPAPWPAPLVPAPAPLVPAPTLAPKDNGFAVSIGGCPKKSKNIKEECSDMEEAKLAVVCCQEDGTVAPLDEAACEGAATYETADEICEESNYRLCTLEEIKKNVQCDSDSECDFEKSRVWTSTTCSLAPAPTPAQILEHKRKKQPAPPAPAPKDLTVAGEKPPPLKVTTGNLAVAKVVELLKELEAQLREDAAADGREFGKYMTWYEGETSNAKQIVETTAQRIEQVQSALKEQEAFRNAKAMKLEEVGNTLVGVEKELQEATTRRGNERKTFEDDERTLLQAIDQLQRSLEVLGKKVPALVEVKAPSAASFLSMAKKIQNMLLQGPDFKLTAMQRETVDAYLRAAVHHRVPTVTVDTDSASGDQAMGLDFLQTGAVTGGTDGEYEQPGGAVAEALQSVLDKAKKELEALREQEKKQSKAFEDLAQGLKDQIQGHQKTIKIIKGEVSESQETSGKDKAEVLASESLLKVTKESLTKVEAEFLSRNASFQERTRERADELLAVQDAARIMNSEEMQKYLPENWGTSGFAQQPAAKEASFLQLGQAQVDSPRTRRAPGLALLSLRSRTRRRSDVSALADPFVKVKALMRDMIAKLKEEESSDSVQHAWCSKETARTVKSKDDTEQEVAKLKAKIAEIDSELDQLKEDLARISDELKVMTEAAEAATALRNSERTAATAAIVRYQDARRLLGSAIAVLQKVYSAKSSAGGGAVLLSEGAAPKVEYGRSDLGAGVIGILEIAVQDFANLQAETETTEKKATKDYKEFMDTTEVRTAVFNKDLEYKDGAKVKLEGDRMRRTKFLEMRVKELEALAKYLTQLEVQCTKKEPDEERKARREAELASLKEALKQLNS